MKGIDPKTCIHHIYIEENSRPIRQPQRRMNPNLKEIVKEEHQKLLNVNSIYPISDIRWVSPLVIVPKKNVYGDSFEEALGNLEKVLLRCRETNLSLSHEKCFMMFNEGIVLGHHISGDGIKVDRSKVEVISKLPIPNCQRDFRSFLGFTGYYRRFIENFIKIAYPLFKLLTKYSEFKWDHDSQTAFETLITRISEAPILRGPNWKLPFHISKDASDTALGATFSQKNLVLYAIYYTNKNLTPTGLNYTVTEKEFLAVIHAINKFKHYITGYETFIHTDHSTIIYLINKPITNGRVIRWLLLLQEFNITVLDRPGKQNIVADFLSMIHNTKEDSLVEDKFPDEYLFAVTTKTHWYVDIASYLVTRKLPPLLFSSERKKFIRESSKYSWISNELFKTGPDLVIRRCVREDEMPDILKACHDEPCSGHFADKRIAYKILSLEYFWPSLSKDAKQYVKSVPREIVTDQGNQFTSNLVEKLMEEYKIKHKRSTSYHPQENGQVESTNKVLESIITKIVHLHRRDWAKRLPEALWAYRTTWRNTIGHSPYELIYGKEVLLPIEFQVKTFKMAVQLRMDLSEAQKHRMEQLNELNEIRQEAILRTDLVQYQRAKWHEKYIKERKFQEGD
eukprot:PITA_29632